MRPLPPPDPTRLLFIRVEANKPALVFRCGDHGWFDPENGAPLPTTWIRYWTVALFD